MFHSFLVKNVLNYWNSFNRRHSKTFIICFILIFNMYLNYLNEPGRCSISFIKKLVENNKFDKKSRWLSRLAFLTVIILWNYELFVPLNIKSTIRGRQFVYLVTPYKVCCHLCSYFVIGHKLMKYVSLLQLWYQYDVIIHLILKSKSVILTRSQIACNKNSKTCIYQRHHWDLKIWTIYSEFIIV